MTGCPGIEDVDFTILSDNPETSGLFRWTKEGKVEETKPEVTNKYHMITSLFQILIAYVCIHSDE